MKKYLLSGIMALAATCSWAQSSPYTGVAPGDIESGKDYYLYNVESGLWLQNNDRKANDWHTRGQLGTRGLDFTLNASGDGYLINAKFGRGSINRDNYYLDSNDDHVWVFETKDGSVSNAVTIKSKTKYLTADKYTAGFGYNNNYNAGTQGEDQWYLNNPDNSTNGTWQIVTKAERLEKMLAAGETEAQDATWLVQSPDFANNDKRYDAWTRTGTWARGGDVNGDWGRGSMIMESWNSGNDPHMYQTVTVPNGRYALTVQGFYRDGNVGEVGGKYNNGTEEIRAKYYINDVEKNLRSIIDGHSEALNSPDRWRMETGGWYVPDKMADCSRCMNISNGYPNDAIEAKVTTGSVRIGVKKTGSVDGDWVIFDNFKLTYLGPIDVSEYITGLNAAITAAEAIDQSKLTEAAKTLLNEKLTAARGYTTSVDADAISAATKALSDVVTDVKDMDIAPLKAAYDYMVGREYDDATANDILANSVKATEVNGARSSLVIRFKQHVADKSAKPTVFTDAAAAVVGEENNEYGVVAENLADGFYLYNVGTGRWFCGGDDWGAHAAVGFPGIKVTTPKNDYGTGHYNSIITWLCNGDWGSNHQLNHGGYCDTGGNGWKFFAKDKANGIYTIAKNGDNTGNNSSNGYGTKNLLGFSDNTLMRLDTDKQGADNPNNQWIFVTEAQRDQMATAAMASASAKNPVDLTYKIGMPGFNQRERVEGSNQSEDKLPWTCNLTNYKYGDNRHIICDRGSNHADFCVDLYGGQLKGSFYLEQTINGLTPGKYRVKVQGYNNGGDDANKAKLVANGQNIVLRERSSETELPWQAYAESTWQAIEYFQNGLYWNEVECFVANDGQLTLGVESPNVTGNHVVLFDNFRLEYIGNTQTEKVVASSAEWATYVPEKSVDFTDADVTAYAVSEVCNGYVKITKVTTVPAGEAVLVNAPRGTHFVKNTSNASLGQTNELLVSEGVEVKESYKDYVLSQTADDAEFNGTNLLEGMTYDVFQYYSHGDNWAQYENPAYTDKNGVITITLPSASDYQWQAQHHLKNTGIQLSKDKKYDFKVVINSNKAFTGATIKLAQDNDDELYIVAERKDLVEGENVFTFTGVETNKVRDISNLKFAFDFGGNPENTIVSISGMYLQENTTTQVGFYPVTKGTTIPAGKGYLVAPTAGAKFISLVEPTGEATQIEGVIVEKLDGTMEVYNLQGQKLQNVQKGINIINGRKVIIK